MLQSIRWENSTVARAASLLRRLARPAALTAAMFLLMRAELLMGAAPLAPAMMSAALAAGDFAAAPVLGCLLGMLRLSIDEISLLPAFGCTMVLAWELIFSFLPARLQPANESRAALSAGFSALLPALIFAKGDPFLSLQALACGMLAAAAAPFLFYVLDREQIPAGQRRSGCILLAAGCLAGLVHLHAPTADVFAALAVLLFPSPLSGTAAGLALAAGGGKLMKLASLALCSLACTAPFLHGRWQKSLAICAAASLARLMSGPEALNPQWALCACAIYLLLPEILLEKAAEAIAPPRKSACNPDEIARELGRETRRKLAALGDAFSAMAEGCTAPPDVPDEQELICEMRARLCAGCAAYEDCWAGSDNRAVRLLCRLIGDALDRVDAPPGMRVLFSDGEIPPDLMRICRRGRMIPDRLGLLLRDFAEKRRSEIKRCTAGQLISLHFTQAHEILCDLAERQFTPAGSQGTRLRRLKTAMDGCEVLACDRGCSRISLLRRERWTPAEARRAHRAVNRCMGGRWLPAAEGAVLRFVRAPRLQVQTGASCQSGIAGEACGDSHMIQMLDDSRLMLVISDGMGTGEAAAAESSDALRLLRCFLEAGISCSLALETVNRQLLAGSGEDMFATMDLCIIDLNSGIAEFTKLAACRTLILRGRELMRIEGGCLPLGILERVQGGVNRVRLRPGDLLIMGSDGVMEAGDALMMERLARDCAQEQSEEIAARMVREAGISRGADRRDDMTCICARILSAG